MLMSMLIVVSSPN